MRIAILTVYTDNYLPLAEIVLPNLKKYCNKHGYELHAENITGTQMYFGYKKIECLFGLLGAFSVDAVLCLDMDTLITNHNIKVESFIDDKHDFYITKDVNGINAGSFIIKNSDWSIEYLRDIFESQEKFECEQNAIVYWMDTLYKYKKKIKILDHPSINSYLYDEYAPGWGVIGDKQIDKPTHEEGDWQKGDFLVHLPGMTLDRRIEIFKHLEKEIIL
jgi:hypothetical protein